MTPPAARPDRRTAHLLSLLPWTADDLNAILARLAPQGERPLAGRPVLFLHEGEPPAEASPLWAGARLAGAEPRAERIAPEGWRAVGVPPEVAAVAAAPWRAAELVPLARRSPRPVVNAGTREADPVRALADYAGLLRLGLEGRGLRVAWRGPATPRLAGWLELATRYALELDVFLDGSEVPDPALVAFARERAKGAVHLPGRPEAMARAAVRLEDAAPGTAGPSGAEVVSLPLSGAPPWPAAWDAALGRAVWEEIVERASLVARETA